ncbi:MAG: YifB family Mg chelatase-like AAA ATPase [Clostridia bacterium]|nr:YifB family Mg chelatase-like AAA ATPase [Clostridia bacterium]
MITKVNSVGLTGMDGFGISVEADVGNGMPTWDVVGMPDTAVKESKERIRSALKNSGFMIPGKRILINLAPADVKKEGASLDLPIAIGILTASDQLFFRDMEACSFFGELSLDGTLRGVRGALPMAITAYRNGAKRLFLPKQNAQEAAVVEGLEVYGVSSMKALLEHVMGISPIEPTKVDTKKLFEAAEANLPDFSEVKGQESAKRALEIAAAGGHNILMIGPPGSGKTMLAQRIPSILPAMTFDEALDVTKVHSIAGRLPKEMAMITARPFRSPHHTVSAVGLTGGGNGVPKPGEISLAHHGILFLDELPEFRKDALEVMRQPLEDGVVTITRAGGTFSYPCNIMLVASMNPCPCGYYGDEKHDCSCSQRQISNYLAKISGPLLDRIDLHIEVPAVDYECLGSKRKSESSAEIKKRVDAAREIQLKRYAGTGIYSNSTLSSSMMDEVCELDAEGSEMLKNAYEVLGLSARAHNRILKVSRTIADLAGSEKILKSHIAEAIRYRSLDRKFWG